MDFAALSKLQNGDTLAKRLVGQNFGNMFPSSILGGGSTERYSAPFYNYPLQGGNSLQVQLPQQIQTPQQQRGK